MIYFDNAATSYPKPRSVISAHAKALSEYGGNPGRSGHRLSLKAAEMVYDCRCRIAEFFGCNAPEHVIFTASATAALNLAINRRIVPGMHILMSDREHNAVARPIFSLARRGVITYSTYPCSGNVVDAIRAKITKSTGLVIACHTSNVTGRTLPFDAIATLCSTHNIPLIVDAAQSAGHRRIDLTATPCDALCFPAHKGLLGAAGLGVAIFADPSGEPLILGGSGLDSLREDMPDTLPERFEAGTLPCPAIAALRAGIDHVCEVGVDEIGAHEEHLHALLCEGLSSINGIRLYEPDCKGSVISFTHRKLLPEQIAAELDSHGICTRAGYHCAPLAHHAIGTPPGGCVRISTSLANTPHEVKRCLYSLNKLLSSPS